MLSEAVLKPTPSLEKILSGEELNFKEGVELMKEENLFLLGAAVTNYEKTKLEITLVSFHLII